MKKRTNTSFVICSVLAMALALSIVRVQSQSESAPGRMMMMDAKMMERCQAMKEQNAKMMTDIKVQDADLAEQLAKMNRAPERKKLDLMAAVVTQMVEQQMAMNARKAKMEGEMMKHMMQHMQMGKESMAQCPMMKGMNGMGEKSEGDHKEHHE